MQNGMGSGLGLAASSLGLGDALSAQTKDETDEERKKRLTRQQQANLLGPAAMSLGLDGTGGVGAY